MPSRVFIILVLVLLPTLAAAQSDSGQERFSLEQPGILIITAGSDTSAGFHWRSGPGTGRISLVWDGGVLSVPDTLAMDGYPNNNLGIPLRPGFSGNGAKGPLLLTDGIYSVKENLMLGDGVIQLMISDGEFEVYGPRFRYSRLQTTIINDKTKANFMMIAGLLLFIAVLLRRARSILRKRK